MKNFTYSINNNSMFATQPNNDVLAIGQERLLVSSKATFGGYPQDWKHGIKSFRAKFNKLKYLPRILSVRVSVS